MIYLGGKVIPYPFQLHLAYAPEDIRRDCVDDLPVPDSPGRTQMLSFGEWIQANLGTGIGRHFMVPYNEKLSTVSVDELTTEWLGRFVPQPSVEEIRTGAEAKRPLETGYNRSFLYPTRGGIATLSGGLAKLVPNLVTNARVVEVDTEAREVRTEDGRSFGYGAGIVATIPLPELATIVKPADPTFAAAADLRANTVTCVNFGLRRANPEFSQYQWIYLSEPQFAAYRLGFYGRFSDEMAPTGRESVYVEVAHDADSPEAEVVAAAEADLVTLGVIDGEGDIETVLPVRIEHAYVIHDKATSGARAALHQALLGRDIFIAGRYATWEYSAMEDAIVEGMRATAKMLDVPVGTRAAE